MKRLSLVFLFAFAAVMASAAERRAPKDVDVAALTRQLTAMAQDEGFTLAIWWPPEIWAIGLAREPGITEDERAQILAKLSRYDLVGVVDGRMTPAGMFEFLPRDAVLKRLNIEWKRPNNSQRLAPLASVPGELKPILDGLEPIMRSALGEMGKNLHIVVIPHDAGSGGKVSPYESGSLLVTLTPTDRDTGTTLEIEAPADALFVSRLCPNGKPAHVTWKVCPWDGSKLPD